MKSRSIRVIMKIFATVSLLLLTLPSICAAKPKANNPKATFAAADAAYAKGEYQQAIALYQKLTAQGYQSGPLYYNLGNAYYKTRATGQAVLYYEKARRLSPGDADLQANLAYALRNVNEGAQTWQNQFWEKAVSSLTLEQAWLYASICFFMLAGLLILLILSPKKISHWKPWFPIVLSLSAVCLAALLSLAFCTEIDRSRTYAVAIHEGGQARFEPNSQATLHFVLPEGARIQILAQKTGWSLVQRRDGVRGWVNSRYLEKI
jgi:tetratricopeptide (TPR) repeat protein